MTFGYPRVPAGFSLGLGPSRARPDSKTSGSGTRKTSKKRLGRARARVGLRPVPPLQGVRDYTDTTLKLSTTQSFQFILLINIVNVRVLMSNLIDIINYFIKCSIWPPSWPIHNSERLSKLSQIRRTLGTSLLSSSMHSLTLILI